jgi:tetratricopeptide (TPR) repeat protein
MPEGEIFEQVLRDFIPARGEGCPELLVLHHFAAGKLSSDEVRAFAPHLRTCLYCQHEIGELRKLLHFEQQRVPYWIDKMGRAVRLRWAARLWLTLWLMQRSWLGRPGLPEWPAVRLQLVRPWPIAVAVLLVVLVVGRAVVSPALAQSQSVIAAAKQVPIIRWLLPASTQEYLQATLLQDRLNQIPGSQLERYSTLAQRAETHLHRAITLDPRYAEAYDALGTLYENWYYQNPTAPGAAKLLDQADAAYTRATQLRPDYLDAYRGLGDIYAATGEFTKEERAYDAILAIDPADSDALSSRGWVRLERGDYQAAIADFRAALRRDPKDFDTLTALVLAYAAHGDVAAIERTYHRLERVNPGRARLLRRLVRPALPRR